MRWRDVLIGALVTLFVTIIAGVIVFYVTSPKSVKGERLVYQVDPSFAFKSAKTKEIFQTIQLLNAGEQPAHGVVVMIDFGGMKIVDHTINSSSEAANPQIQDSSTEQKIVFRVPSLLPNEKTAISVMLEGGDHAQPIVSIRSDESAGTSGSIDQSSKAEGRVKHTIASYLVYILAALQLVVVLSLRGPLGRILRRLLPSSRSINNTAFLYLHTGLSGEALKLLKQGIESRGADALMLANYGLALALTGDRALAENHIRAASIYTEQTHERAVVLFNHSLIQYYYGEIAEGESSLTRALKASRTIRTYLGFSFLVRDLRKNIPQFDAYLKRENVGQD